jgi:AraC family transcriptional regulator, transcriptional activator of the genes for pyochelin and ferripyochelin receptors
MEETKHQETEYGSVDTRVWDFDDIRMGHAISKFHRHTRFSSPGSQKDVIRVHFGMRGNYSFTYQQLNKTFDLIGGHHNMMYSKEFNMIVENRTLELETFGIQFPRELFIRFTENADDLLKRFSENIILGNNVILAEDWGVIHSGISQVIDQIIHCQYRGDLKKLFLLSKSIELLVLSAEACQSGTSKKDLFIKNKSDKEKIIAVRDLIHERIHCPPNLSEIAKAVGLNEYKLKRGFKETFNNTVFGYLADQRLQLAHRYLKDTQKTAAEIAFDLGYTTPQHFNNAFKKKFGFTPFSVRNNP